MSYFKIRIVTATGNILDVHTVSKSYKKAQEFAKYVTEEDNTQIEKLFGEHWYLRSIMKVSYQHTGITRHEIQQAFLEGITTAFYQQKKLTDYCLPALCLNFFNEAVKEKVKEIE